MVHFAKIKSKGIVILARVCKYPEKKSSLQMFCLQLNCSNCILEHEGRISLPSFDEKLPNFWSQVLTLADPKGLV